MIGKFLIVFGVTLVIAGLLWPLLQKTGIGRLPGDIVFAYGGVTVYIPLGVSIVLSVLFTAILWFMNR